MQHYCYLLLLQTEQQKHSQQAGDCLGTLVTMLKMMVMGPAMLLEDAQYLWQACLRFGTVMAQ